jgi:hypothetical protein
MSILPQAAESANIRALANRKYERFTGLTGTVITLHNPVVLGTEQVFKNGALLDPVNNATYFLQGNTLTLGSALISTDVLVVHYHFRTATT